MKPSTRIALEDVLFQAGLVGISSVLLVAIILFVLTTTWAEYSSNRQQALSFWVSADVGTTILAVRILQGLLTAAATAAICASFTRLHWRRTNGYEGLRLAELIALSPTTLFTGTIHVIFSSNAGRTARLWATSRLILTTLPWLGGILLFARTSLITVFDTANVYDVTAGIGPFNASYVNPFLDLWTDGNITSVPYSYFAVVHNLITNNLYSTVTEPQHCTRSESNLGCSSYILSGGLSLAAPWTPPGNPEHQLVSIPKVPGVQVEFVGRSGPKDFQSDDCVLFGSNDALIGAELCLSLTDDGSLHAGLFVCNGTSPSTQKCITPSSGPQPNLTTTLSLSSLTTTVLSSRSNLSVISVSSLSPPIPLPFSTSSLAAYRSSLNFLLNYTHSNIPAPSSILEMFWSNADSLNDTHADGVVLQNFRSLLVFPVWLFNANNYGNVQVKDKVLNEGLPREFYTRAAVVKSLVKLKFDKGSVVVFVFMEVLVLLVAWGLLVWLFLPLGRLWKGTGEGRLGASTTAFPVVDFLFKAEVARDVGEREREELKGLGSGQVLERFGRVRIHARNADIPISQELATQA